MEAFKNEEIKEEYTEETTREQMYSSLREVILRSENDLDYLNESLEFFNCQLKGIAMEEKGFSTFKENIEYGKILKKLDKLQRKLIYKNTNIGEFENKISNEISKKKFCDLRDSKNFEKKLRKLGFDIDDKHDFKKEDYSKELNELTEELYDNNVASEYSNFLESLKKGKNNLFENEKLYKEILDNKRKDFDEVKKKICLILNIKENIDRDKTISKDEAKLMLDIYYKAINLIYRLYLVKLRDVKIIEFGLSQKALNTKLKETQKK